MKNSFLTFLIFFICLVSTEAQQFDIINIRNFNSSLIISNNKGTIEQIQFKDYGEIKSHTNTFSRYIYQGQEIDTDLNLCLFMSRIYSPIQKQFFQPDPLSQYKSPYLFVASDPINIIDLKGLAGRPLILYEEESEDFIEDTRLLEDLRSAVPNSHFIPMSDFLNGNIGELPEWNGNVFVYSHMGAEGADRLEVERFYGEGMQRTDGDFTKQIRNNRKDITAVDMDSKEFGRKLRTFADERGVRVKNIVAGGCQGAETGNQIALGYTEKASRKKFSFFRKKKKLNVLGAHEGNNLVYTGSRKSSVIARMERALPFKKSRIYMLPKGTTHEYQFKTYRGQKYLATYRVSTGRNSSRELEYLDHNDIGEFVNGRVPESMTGFFNRFKITY